MVTGKENGLFSTVRIGTMELKTRLVRSATAERMASEPVGRATPRLEGLYSELARGGVGLIVTGHAFITPEGKTHPEMLGVHCDELIPGLRLLADAAHANGGRIALQINHGGRQADREAVPVPLAPSPLSSPGGRTPREMSPAEIAATVDAFGQAACRAKVAGMDAVQIHAAHGYLISQFLSPNTNRRIDDWGGDFDRRLHFLAAVCEEVRGQVGPDYPVFIKLGMVDNLEQIPGGLSPEDGTRIVGRLADLGLDAVEISGAHGGGADFNILKGIKAGDTEAYFRPLARRAKATTQLPVILVGGLRSRSVMDDVLASGDADLISLCRPLIREPDLPNRLQRGETAVAACISGGRCWAKGLDEGIRCRCES